MVTCNFEKTFIIKILITGNKFPHNCHFYFNCHYAFMMGNSFINFSINAYSFSHCLLSLLSSISVNACLSSYCHYFSLEASVYTVQYSVYQLHAWTMHKQCDYDMTYEYWPMLSPVINILLPEIILHDNYHYHKTKVSKVDYRIPNSSRMNLNSQW